MDVAHGTPLIATIVAGLGLAFVLGAIADRLRISPLVGYLLAGVVVGPYTPGFIADQDLANELAEIGVVLLMFGVGLHFSLKDLLSVRLVAIPGAIVQILIATGMGVGLSMAMGWPLGGGFVFGLALSVASTVVLLRALNERHLIDTERGRIAIGWLIVEDIAMVLALVLLPAISGLLPGAENAPEDSNLLEILSVLAITVGKVGAFVVLMLVVGSRVIPWILHYIAHTGSRELFRLAVLAIALGIAFGAAKLFGASFALGAFFAGMILGESQLSQRAAEETLPLRDAFAVLFFVSVGMMFDPMILIEDPLPVLATLFIIVFGKSVVAFVIVRAFKKPFGTALLISVSLAQIGEFSFILATMGVNLGLLPEEGRDLILAGAMLSILLNPLAFSLIGRVKTQLERGAPPSAPVPSAEGPPTEIASVSEPALQTQDDSSTPAHQKHVVLVGYGRVGSLVGEALQKSGTPFTVIETTDAEIDLLRKSGAEFVIGNAVHSDVLRTANIAQARMLLIAIPNSFEAGQIIQKARAINPGVIIIARAHSDAEFDHLKRLGSSQVIMGEREIARGMIACTAAE